MNTQLLANLDADASPGLDLSPGSELSRQAAEEIRKLETEKALLLGELNIVLSNIESGLNMLKKERNSYYKQLADMLTNENKGCYT